MAKKYIYDMIEISTVEPWGEGDMWDLERAGAKGYRVVHVFGDINGNGGGVLIEKEYEGETPRGSWIEQPDIE